VTSSEGVCVRARAAGAERCAHTDADTDTRHRHGHTQLQLCSRSEGPQTGPAPGVEGGGGEGWQIAKRRRVARMEKAMSCSLDRPSSSSRIGHGRPQAAEATASARA